VREREEREREREREREITVVPPSPEVSTVLKYSFPGDIVYFFLPLAGTLFHYFFYVIFLHFYHSDM